MSHLLCEFAAAKHGPLQPARLIINADDFGYFPATTMGIIEAARCGLITATGVLTNSWRWQEEAGELRRLSNIDVGVHLTLTSGKPISGIMGNFVERDTGNFRFGKFGVATALSTRRMSPEAVRIEWDAQISLCKDAKIHPVFLNSHEHVHMLPSLFPIVCDLACQHDIEWVRWSSPEWPAWHGMAAWIRAASLQVFSWINAAARPVTAPRLIGLNCSGRLSFQWLRNRLATLKQGAVYELMCHPGIGVTRGQIPKHLEGYHDWVGELEALRQAQTLGLLDAKSVQLVRFSDLSPS